MKKMAIIMGIFLVMSSSGCSTMEGVGKDIKKAGEAIERKAKR